MPQAAALSPTPETTLRAARWPDDQPVTAALWRAYVDYLHAIDCYDLGGETVEAELVQLSDFYVPGRGVILIAERAGEPIGTVAIRRRDAAEAEVRRLFVNERARGEGLGRRLLEAAIAEAEKLGYRRLKLDTFRQVEGPQALYRGLGFIDVAAYNDYPAERAMWMEKIL